MGVLEYYKKGLAHLRGLFLTPNFLNFCKRDRLMEQKKDPNGIGSFLLSKFESDW